MPNNDELLEKVTVDFEGIQRRPYTHADLEERVTSRIQEMRENGELGIGETSGPATQWLANYGRRYQEQIELVPFENPDGTTECFFIKTLRDADLTEISLTIAREGVSLARTDDLEFQHIFSIAILMVGTCAGANNAGRFFNSYSEAKLFYEGHGPVCEYSRIIRGALAAINPVLEKKNLF